MIRSEKRVEKKGQTRASAAHDSAGHEMQKEGQTLRQAPVTYGCCRIFRLRSRQAPSSDSRVEIATGRLVISCNDLISE